MSDFLFACGLGRSGTTALVEVLNGHADIALGMERFKMLWRRSERLDELGPELWEPERFFDFSDGLTNITPQRAAYTSYYATITEKYDTARYHGDKVNELIVPELVEIFPQARFVLIAREITGMAHSWDVRAKNPEDPNWGANRDARNAVTHWNRSLPKIIDAVTRFPDQVTLVEYDSFFSAPDGAPLRAALERLELPWTEGIARSFGQAHTRFRDDISVRPRVLEPEVVSYIAEEADHATWDRVTSLAV